MPNTAAEFVRGLLRRLRPGTESAMTPGGAGKTEHMPSANGVARAESQDPGAVVAARLAHDLGDDFIFYSTAPDGRLLWASDAFRELLGFEPGELNSYAELLTDNELNRDAEALLKRARRGDSVPSYPIQLRAKDGRIVDLIVKVSAVFGDHGNLLSVDGVGIDLTKRLRSDELSKIRARELEQLVDARTAELRESEIALRTSEARLRQLASAVRSMLWIYDTQAESVVYCNEAGEQVLSKPLEEILASGWWHDNVHPDDRRRLDEKWDELKRNGFYEVNYRTEQDGDWRWMWERGVAQFGAAGELTQVFGTTEDVTISRRREQERLQLEEELLQSQKMETVGQLAGGVAHDFNNLLTVIAAHTELMEQNVEPASEVARSLAAVEDAVRQATRVSRSLLAFSKPATPVREHSDLAQLVAQIGRMVQRILPASIECQITIPDEPGPWVDVDPIRIQQVLLNLALNARDAMPDGGRLDLEVGGPAVESADEEPTAWIAVRDTGQGVQPAMQAHIFEPFFTTRPPGKGTGLGLAVARRIIADHGGELLLDSSPGEGSTFTIRLPAANAGIPVVEPSRQAPPQHDGHCVLLAEDDEQVRSVLASGLMAAGYEVHQAVDGQELLDGFDARSDRIDLMIVDVDLPKRNGLESLLELRDRGVLTPAIAISGNPELDVEHERLAPFDQLPKPFQIKRLLEAARDLLLEAKESSLP